MKNQQAYMVMEEGMSCPAEAGMQWLCFGSDGSCML